MLKSFFNFVIDIIYKENCCICNNKNAENFLCKSCAKTISFLPTYTQDKIKGVNIFSATSYKDNIKLLIHHFKFRNKKNLYKHLAIFLYKYFEKTFDNKDFIIIPTPSFKKRISKRGYDHIMLICKEFSRLSGIPVKDDILLKIKDTKPQYNLNKEEREKNIKDSFFVNVNNYKGENLLIIDDIITTGSTISEIIKEFQKNNINNLVFLTLSKVIK